MIKSIGRFGIYFVLGACCLCVLALVSCSGKSDHAQTKMNPPTHIPPAGHIGKIQVQVTTMEQLEAMFGKGRAFTGGHAGGAREWFSVPTGWYVYADGFDYSSTGRVVDSFEISLSRHGVADKGSIFDTDSTIHQTSVKKDELTFCYGIALGMNRATVIDLLHKHGIKTSVTGDVIKWKESGFVRVNFQSVVETWSVELNFNQDKLDDILVN